MSLVVLAIAAFLTSIISAIIGMGGGILLLAVMFSFLDHAQAIPVHGGVQLASNGTRLLAFARHIDWPTLRRFALGAIPGSVAGGLALAWMRGDRLETTEPFFKIAIGLYVLGVTFSRSRRQAVAAREDARPQDQPFAVFGFLSGTLGLTVGAVGPLIAPLFLRSGFAKERVIATKATCQACIHIMKIPVFLLGDFVDFGELGLLIVVMSAMVIPGTLLGRRLLRYVSERTFVRLYQVALFVAGVKVLAYDGVYKLVQ